MNEASPELSILMPCLNEELTLATCITKAKTYLDTAKVNGEIVIADNGSTDRSIEIAESLGARVVHVAEKGYGSALLNGIKAARGKYVIMGDSDDSYDFLHLGPYVEKLREGNDLVMGNRFKGGIAKGAMPFLHRYLGNPVLSFTGRLFFNIRVRDFHCGLRGFNRERILSTGLCTTGMEFASEMVVKSALNGLKITEVPTTLKKDGRDRPPHLNTWRDGWRHLRFLLIYSPRWLFFIPGLIFLLAGSLLSLLLMIKPIHLKSIELDVHTLLYAGSSIFIGLQFIFFYAIAKVYGGIHHLLPRDRHFYFWTRLLSLEKCILAGAIFILAALILTIWVLLHWYRTGFGHLNPSDTFRMVIPAVFSLIFGLQLIQNSFFISILMIRTKD
ncbi:MAG TPA: glycosyltransferase family 2 protein [Bacteroidales bacterium]|nr:glycosyltransferase family 2 protein [Bacteroidales bacterium]HSA42435.1 glycosyltransferase family 2 protein [Bacteroidales bacterium]